MDQNLLLRRGLYHAHCAVLARLDINFCFTRKKTLKHFPCLFAIMDVIISIYAFIGNATARERLYLHTPILIKGAAT